MRELPDGRDALERAVTAAEQADLLWAQIADDARVTAAAARAQAWAAIADQLAIASHVDIDLTDQPAGHRPGGLADRLARGGARHG